MCASDTLNSLVHLVFLFLLLTFCTFCLGRAAPDLHDRFLSHAHKLIYNAQTNDKPHTSPLGAVTRRNLSPCDVVFPEAVISFFHVVFGYAAFPPSILRRWTG